MSQVPSDIEIAQAATPRPIAEIAAKVGLTPDDYDQYGKIIAKLSRDKTNILMRDTTSPNGKLVLVTAMNPTPAGEGKTTT